MEMMTNLLTKQAEMTTLQLSKKLNNRLKLDEADKQRIDNIIEMVPTLLKDKVGPIKCRNMKNSLHHIVKQKKY